MFKIIKKDKNTNARLGVLITPHGKIETPSYVIVATHAEVRCLKPSDIKKTGTQVIIANTFHLWNEVLNSKFKTLNKSQIKNSKPKTFLTKKLGAKLPTMTDSGGFQVLSLAFGDKNKVGKFMTGEAKADDSYKRSHVRVTQKGVYFKFDGKKLFLGPELSMQLQQKIGGDIIFAFDHITSPLDSHGYNKKAVELTNKWAETCLAQNARCKAKNRQMLFGIVQGGVFKDLRIKSAKSISSMPFDGFGIGGSYTKKQITKMLKWVIPHLPEEKPRHLLGVGKVADIFEAVANGIDTFDCVIPTREARHGRIYNKTGYYDTSKYQSGNIPLEKGCKCPACRSDVTRKKLYELFKSAQLVRQAQGKRWATIHNIWFFNNLLFQIRDSIQKGKFLEFKNQFLTEFSK